MSLSPFIRNVLEDLWVRFDFEKIDDHFAPDFYGEMDGEIIDRRALKKWVKDYAACYAAATLEIKDTIEEKGKIATRIIYRVLDTKTKKNLTLQAITIFHIKEKKIKAIWSTGV